MFPAMIIEKNTEIHTMFLNPHEGETILLIEDMKLDLDTPYDKVIVEPLITDKADGVPCTVIADSD